MNCCLIYYCIRLLCGLPTKAAVQDSTLSNTLVGGLLDYFVKQKMAAAGTVAMTNAYKGLGLTLPCSWCRSCCCWPHAVLWRMCAKFQSDRLNKKY